jgi:hypothetical protein
MFDLATAKARLGITGTAQDTLVQTAITTTLEIAERYCDRKFTYAAETVKFYHFLGETFFLPRYPVQDVISHTGLPDQMKVHHRLGTVELHYAQFIEEAEFVYTGGYSVLPADLELALWGIFNGVWPSINGGSSVAVGAIDSITIPDVGTIRYNNSGSSASSSASAGNANVLGPYYSILDTYRRVTC